MNPSLLQKLVKVMNHENVTLSIPCLRTIGNIVTGDDDQTQQTIDAGLIGAINTNLTHSKKTVRKETCWVLSNITAGNQSQIQACIDSGIIEKLVDIIIVDDTQVKNEAIWALSNCTAQASPEQFNQLVHLGMTKALGSILTINNPRMISVALEGLTNIFEVGEKQFKNEQGENSFTLEFERLGFLDNLEDLQKHKNH
mmetsp:Transcript_11035/g.18451  ORF Transcript_11035/g.18451 Transcript_11035/m.18451 type:complete len:198 (+) Transcript_11035:1043-1636(+)